MMQNELDIDIDLVLMIIQVENACRKHSEFHRSLSLS
jgi:hypothetical protein